MQSLLMIKVLARKPGWKDSNFQAKNREKNTKKSLKNLFSLCVGYEGEICGGGCTGRKSCGFWEKVDECLSASSCGETW